MKGSDAGTSFRKQGLLREWAKSIDDGRKNAKKGGHDDGFPVEYRRNEGDESGHDDGYGVHLGSSSDGEGWKSGGTYVLTHYRVAALPS